MKACWFGIYDTKYSRVDILLTGVKKNGVEVVECHADPKEKGRYSKLRYALRALNNDYDLIYTAYPATMPTILAKLTSRKPVFMDAFYSMFDAVVSDRHEIPWYHPRALKLLALDWLSAVMADYLIVDTLEHKKYWLKFPCVRAAKIFPIYIGANDSIFHPLAPSSPAALASGRAAPPTTPGSAAKKNFTVSFHGTFIPLQGIDKIIEAARILSDDSGIRFLIIGGGQENAKVDKLIERYKLTNIERRGRIAQGEINGLMNGADLVLGIFGDTPKAARVIPNKLYEGMAAGRPVITMDSPAMREVFTDEDVYMVKNDPQSIADGIRKLKNDDILRATIARNGYRKVLERFVPQSLGKALAEIFITQCPPHNRA